jgi:hydroxymethylpyrimidine pyrophosphatase-like HAD family hydrolase
MPSDIRLIAIDIDGTLLRSYSTEISQRNREALKRAVAAGVEIAIATGRRHRYAMPIIEQAPLPAKTVVISSNGSVTRTLDGERLARFTLPVETARDLCPALREFGGTTVFTFDHDGPGELVVESIAALHTQIRLWVQANLDSLREVRPLERVFEDGSAPIQGMICGGGPEMRAAEVWLSGNRLGETIEMHRTEYPDRNLTILDLLPPGCSKGVALKTLAETRGFGADQVMAIGDNWNDWKMLEWAGRPVVMSNGAPDLVQIAEERGWPLAPSNDDDGVGQAIEAVLDGTFPERFGARNRPSTVEDEMVKWR